MSLNPAEAVDERSLREMEKYVVERIAGQGTFGTVHLAKNKATGAQVAIKKVIQDPRFRNRELQIMQELAQHHHPNVVQLLTYYFTCPERTSANARKEVYLNVVVEFVPETLHRHYRTFYRHNMLPPPILIKAFMYQLLRSIAFLHLKAVNVCHRDIKPHNVLVNDTQGTLKLCDFGSAKKLSPQEPNVAYICSRYYRAPELIFGNQHYTTAVDVWSVGCIFGELMIGEPLFHGENSADQLQEIVRILGRPTSEELAKINPNNTSFPIKDRKGEPWTTVIRRPPQKEALELLTKLLRYSPDDRITAMEALCHPYFDELRERTTKLPSGKDLPASLFEFLPIEINEMTEAQLAKLVRK